MKLFVEIIPPSPEVMVLTGWSENVQMSECLQEPTFKYLLLNLYSEPRAWQASSIIKKLYKIISFIWTLWNENAKEKGYSQK